MTSYSQNNDCVTLKCITEDYCLNKKKEIKKKSINKTNNLFITL